MKNITLVIVFILTFRSLALAGAWDDIADKNSKGAEKAKKITDGYYKKELSLARSKSGGAISTFDSRLVTDKIDFMKESTANLFRICVPVPENLFDRGGGAATLALNAKRTKQSADELYKKIDLFIGFVYSAFESPQSRTDDQNVLDKLEKLEAKLQSGTVKALKKTDDQLGRTVFNKEGMKRNAVDTGVNGLNPLEYLWYEYKRSLATLESADSYATGGNGALTDFLGGASESKYRMSNSSPRQVAQAAMAQTRNLLQSYHPGSTVSCVNKGSGNLVNGLQSTTYEDFVPLVFEEVAPPFKYTWTVKDYQTGTVQLAIQRDSELHAQQHTASIVFDFKEGAWEANFRTVNIGAGLSASRSYTENTTDSWKSAHGAYDKGEHKSAQFSDDSETSRFLNWYYHARYLPACTVKDTCSVIGFFSDLTNRDYAKSVLESAKPAETSVNPKKPEISKEVVIR